MNIKDIQKEEVKDVVLTFRTTKQVRDWIKNNNISVGLLVEKAIEELKSSGEDIKMIEAKKKIKGGKRK